MKCISCSLIVFSYCFSYCFLLLCSFFINLACTHLICVTCSNPFKYTRIMFQLSFQSTIRPLEKNLFLAVTTKQFASFQLMLGEAGKFITRNACRDSPAFCGLLIVNTFYQVLMKWILEYGRRMPQRNSEWYVYIYMYIHT